MSNVKKVGRGCIVLCVCLILGNKGPLFLREAAGRNLAPWLVQVPLLSAAFSCFSWHHPLPKQLMRQDKWHKPQTSRIGSHCFCSFHTHLSTAEHLMLTETILQEKDWLFSKEIRLHCVCVYIYISSSHIEKVTKVGVSRDTVLDMWGRWSHQNRPLKHEKMCKCLNFSFFRLN